MQQVDHYLKQAKAARALAATAETRIARSQFEAMAEGWEQLARERQELLQAKSEAVNGSASMDGTAQNMRGDAIRLNRQ